LRTIDAEGLHVCDLVPDTVGRHEVHPGYASSSRVRAEDAKLVTHTQWCRLTLPQNLVHAEEFTGLRLMGTDGDGPASPIQGGLCPRGPKAESAGDEGGDPRQPYGDRPCADLEGPPGDRAYGMHEADCSEHDAGDREIGAPDGGHEPQRSASSRAVAASVDASRYFTMIGA